MHRFEELCSDCSALSCVPLPIASNRCAPAAARRCSPEVQPGGAARARSTRALARQPRVGGPPKTRRRHCLPPAVDPSQTKTPKTRDLHQDRRSITTGLRPLCRKKTAFWSAGPKCGNYFHAAESGRRWDEMEGRYQCAVLAPYKERHLDCRMVCFLRHRGLSPVELKKAESWTLEAPGL